MTGAKDDRERVAALKSAVSNNLIETMEKGSHA
jgi:hypothetical protein